MTARGIIFTTLEDETGWANLVIWPQVFDRFRRTVLSARLLMVDGRLQREDLVIHVAAEKMVDLSDRLRLLYDRAETVAVKPAFHAAIRAQELPDAGPRDRRRPSDKGD